MNTTSFEVKGCPSLQVAPSRSVIVSCVPSPFHSYDLPRSGFGSLLFTFVMKNSDS
ncbi:hypothetical protein P9139_11660 [Curtobacterium flaccumfaciens]|nr:hypothetical protein P9139_11660 [Curtobacterium flaccumfaciens]